MLLGGVHVGADEDAVEDAAAELLVDEALVVLKRGKGKNVGNGIYFLSMNKTVYFFAVVFPQRYSKYFCMDLVDAMQSE